ncbi:MAG TPA: insulinase family protein, partial [Spirochaetia bacterium]|nr:insulinase family protein [Spirochaetia bacterium]
MTTPDSIGAFQVLARRELPEYRSSALHVLHVATGCEVLHIASADTENLFAFCFATPPRDNTGVSHITEHSVLSGSRRFPLKEPFSALMKGSMNTFLNALTYPDRTVYPAASCNRADFFNLLDVYGDAVFFPLLRKETFMQEGWRLEPVDGSQDEFRYAGVVYNEMKGAYSSPESIVGEWAFRSLFPDTPYGFDSGGDPRFLPSLTLEQAREFHHRYYHPSNCRIFFYGNIPAEESLQVLHDRFLSGFSALKIDSSIPVQPRWTEPRTLEKSFPVKPDTPVSARSSVTMSWLLPAAAEPFPILAREILSEVLIGSAGSPLRKRLIDSGLGQDLSPVSGLETDLKELVFAVGLRGTDPDRSGKISSIVMETLSTLAAQGLDRGLVDSIVNRVEFRHREIRGNGSPYALRLMGRALRGWVHGVDPIFSLEFDTVMAETKSLLARETRMLEQMIEKELLSNPHRVTLVVEPDRGQQARDAAAEKALVDEAVRRLSPDRRARLLADAKDFKAYQMTPDSPQALAVLPRLRRADLPREIERIPITQTSTASNVALSLHGIFTNEVVYIDLCFPTERISGEKTLLLPLFGRAVTGSGLPGRSYDKVALDLFRLTGGFSASLDAGGIVGKPESFAQHAFFRMRCLRKDVSEAAALIASLLAAADFRDLARLRDLVLELRNGMKASIVPGGHQFAMLRAASMLSPSVAREEEWRGITQLLFLEGMIHDLDARLPSIAENLESIRSDLLVRSNLLANATTVEEAFGESSRAVDLIAEALPLNPRSGPPAQTQATHQRGVRAESFLSSASVGYVARAIPGFRYEHPDNGPSAVLGHLLSTGYLWEKVRMEGGAYGAFSFPRNMEGLFLFGSYRDPHITGTLVKFREGLTFIEGGTVDEDEVEKAVIGSIGREDRPLDPGERGFVSLQRRLHAVTDEMRQERRDRLIATRRAQVVEAARELSRTYDDGFTTVIANRASLGEAAAAMP